MGTKVVRLPEGLLEDLKDDFGESVNLGAELLRIYTDYRRVVALAEVVRDLGIQGATPSETLLNYVKQTEGHLAYLQQEVQDYEQIFRGIYLLFEKADQLGLPKLVKRPPL